MTEQSEARTDLNGEISLVDIICFFRQSWGLITVFGVLGLALSATYVLAKPAQCEATLRIKMAQEDGSRYIETPAELVERLKFPTVYTVDALRKCGVAEGDDVGLYMDGRVKASVIGGVADVIDIKLNSNKPDDAKSCANALLNMISAQQQKMIEDVLKGKQEQLNRIKESLANEEKRLDRIRQGEIGAIAHLASLVRLTSLSSGIDHLSDEIWYAKLHPTKLVSPIYVSTRPTPKMPMIVWLNAFAGLALGVVLAVLRNHYRRLSEQK